MTLITPPPESLQTLTEILRYRKETTPSKKVLYLLHRTEIKQSWTYEELYHVALHVARFLQGLGIQKGDRVILVLPTSEEFFHAYWGVLALGAVPVPLYPPIRLHRMDDYEKYIENIARDCDAHAIITDKDIGPMLYFLKRDMPQIPLVKIHEAETFTSALDTPVQVSPDDTGLIQYTSGSTAMPKGVVLLHRNLIANVRNIGLHVGLQEEDKAVCWLPLYHDMGLIGHVIGAFYWGVPLYLFPPTEFIRRPSFWLKSISKYRATISSGPNFAYNYCYQRIRDIELEGIDLSSWRIAFCGAEPILPETLLNFAHRFKQYGFSEKAFIPAYGLAENTLAVTLVPPGRELVVDIVERKAFETEGRAIPVQKVKKASIETLAWVSCGPPVPETKIAIVDDDGKEVSERIVGNIVVQSPSMMKEYHQRPEATAETIKNGWLWTGDLGYIADGELYVTGRKKELIIRGGRNYYPQDIERVVNQIEGVRKGDVIAFGTRKGTEGTKRIVVVAETKSKNPQVWKELKETIQKQVLKETGIPVHEVVLVKPGTIPKTSSGKLQRVRLRHMYERGDITPLRKRQIAKEIIPKNWRDRFRLIQLRYIRPYLSGFRKKNKGEKNKSAE